MTAISGSAVGKLQRSDRLRSRSTGFVVVLAVGLSLLLVIAGWSVLNRVGLLLGWNDTYTGAGVLTVVGCEPESVLGPDRWRCEGRLAGPEVEDSEATLIVGKDGRLSFRPYVGQQVPVFYAPGTASGPPGSDVVYARDAQLNELARLYLILLPLMMIIVGAGGLMIGLIVDGISDRGNNTGSRWRTRPLFRNLKRQGTIWLIAGGAAFVVYQLVVLYVLGSAGVA